MFVIYEAVSVLWLVLYVSAVGVETVVGVALCGVMYSMSRIFGFLCKLAGGSVVSTFSISVTKVSKKYVSFCNFTFDI